MAQASHMLVCDQPWEDDGTCAGSLSSQEVAQELAAFSPSDLSGEHLALMFGAGLSSAGVPLLVILAASILLKSIRRL